MKTKVHEEIRMELDVARMILAVMEFQLGRITEDLKRLEDMEYTVSRLTRNLKEEVDGTESH